ncbi:hypothetical protein BMF94_6463 [Rhodotorula taiwanensis]|uniref:Amino acid permease/ SLC12A domain-containing protein n=1 Tax=Rhodotorula taiwanensis TaxID=741276 RepID=A0A2S5B190_9BASI|nr:hypothetical protein BMF94_6463 [Rhodotorula taiwanensis]
MMRRKDEEAGTAAFTGIEPVMSGRDPQGGTLKIRFSPLSMAFLCFTVISTAPSWAGSLSTALYSGGPTTMIFGYLIVAFCSLCGAASLAEMVSIWPTAEGQIAWTENMAPENCAGFLRYWVAWLTCSGWIALTMSAKFICAVGITAIAAACHPDYAPTQWQTALVFWAIAILAVLTNIFGLRAIPRLNTFTGAVSITVTLVIVILLFVRGAGNFNSGKFVFTELINRTGYTSNGIVFIIGMVSGAYSIMGYDSIAHLCEEMYEPAINAPRAMLGSVLISVPAGLLFILAFLFTVKDIDTVATQLFPILYVLEQATLSTAGAIVLTVALSSLTAAVASISSQATASRVIWSFALDGGIPFSRWFTKISSTNHVPVRALLVVCVTEMLLVLIYIGNAPLFNSILVLAISLLNLSYAVPISLMLFRGRPSGQLPKAPFRLPRVLGMICNSVAIVYQVFISIMLFLPTYHPVTAGNMNFAVAIFGGFHLLGGIYWFFGGQKRTHTVHEAKLEAEGEGSEFGAAE